MFFPLLIRDFKGSRTIAFNGAQMSLESDPVLSDYLEDVKRSNLEDYIRFVFIIKTLLIICEVFVPWIFFKPVLYIQFGENCLVSNVCLHMSDVLKFCHVS